MIYDEKKHESKVKMPRKSDYTQFWFSIRGECLCTGYGTKELSDFLKSDEELLIKLNMVSYDADRYGLFSILKKNEKCSIETEFNEALFNEAKQEYFKDAKDASNRYTMDLFEYGKTILPYMTERMHDIIFNRAWVEGHSSGYSSVEDEYTELCEMLYNIDPKMGAKE